MKAFAFLILCLGLVALADAATTSAPPCSWPMKVTGKGMSNVFFPDTDATYWVMPVDTTQWQSLTLQGKYTDSRFFSFTTYYNLQHPSPNVVDDIIDIDISPDAGSTNPFQHPQITAPGIPRAYTITFDANSSGTGNHVQWAAGQTTYVVYRIYVPDRGLKRRAGAPLPQLTLVDNDGNQQELARCPAGNSELSSFITAVESSSTAPPPMTCPASQPQSPQIAFTPNTGGGGIFGNPVTTYVAARNLCISSGQIAVLRGKAPDFPDTYNGSTIYQPALLPGPIQLRYWSMCNNKEELPRPVTGCKADFDTVLDAQRFYTYVTSTDTSRPTWLPPEIGWIPWGDPTIQNALLFRDMLPADGFTLSGPYIPIGAFCDQQTFVSGGWQACFAAAQGQ